MDRPLARHFRLCGDGGRHPGGLAEAAATHEPGRKPRLFCARAPGAAFGYRMPFTPAPKAVISRV